MATTTSSRAVGVGRVLVAVYGILALAATGRSVFQIIDRFGEAPIAFTLSALSAVVYIVATVALLLPGCTWYRVAWFTIGFELVGVLVVGTMSVVAPSVLGLHSVNPFGRDATVWSGYGLGYLLVPLALPVLGMLWLYRRRPTVLPEAA
ncbi:MAG: integral rane protein [Microbacteriaceae bacterium]|nr:integral rane protein [Microbacteriaceae bacterium]